MIKFATDFFQIERATTYFSILFNWANCVWIIMLPFLAAHYLQYSIQNFNHYVHYAQKSGNILFDIDTPLYNNFPWRTSRAELRLVTVCPIKRQRWSPGDWRLPHRHRRAWNGRQSERNQDSLDVIFLLFSRCSFFDHVPIKTVLPLTSDVMFSITARQRSDRWFYWCFEFNQIEYMTR